MGGFKSPLLLLLPPPPLLPALCRDKRKSIAAAVVEAARRRLPNQRRRREGKRQHPEISICPRHPKEEVVVNERKEGLGWSHSDGRCNASGETAAADRRGGRARNIRAREGCGAMPHKRKL
jgi:hypothetical protein